MRTIGLCSQFEDNRIESLLYLWVWRGLKLCRWIASQAAQQIAEGMHLLSGKAS